MNQSRPPAVSMDAIYDVVTGGTGDDGRQDTTCTAVAERLGRDRDDPQVIALIRAMIVSGFLRQTQLGALKRGPVRLQMSQATMDRKLDDRLAASQAAGTLTTHAVGRACTLGLWHEGPCPDVALETQLRADDAAQDAMRLLKWQRRTCEVHRGWMHECAFDPAHLVEDSQVLDWAGRTRQEDQHLPHSRELRQRAELIRQHRQPRPEKNPYTGTLNIDDFMPAQYGPDHSLPQIIQGHRWTAHNFMEKHLNGEAGDNLDSSLWWHAVCDGLERRLQGLPDVDHRGRPKPSGVPDGVA